MPRKLKTYQTSVGFFDLAIAAPSMKAAAEAWGSQIDVFRRGLASETHDPTIVNATMARPGAVLKRPVGSNQPFSEHAELPRLPNIDSVKENAPPRSKSKEPPTRKTDDKAAALAFASEQKKREAARRKEEADREKKRNQREQAIATAERAFALAEREHQKKVKKIDEDRASVDERSKTESARWETQKRKLESALRRARDW
jgi:colicin import membrane protein